MADPLPQAPDIPPGGLETATPDGGLETATPGSRLEAATPGSRLEAATPGSERFGAAMGLALAEARLAAEHADVPVGAVVLAADGTVLGTGHNARERDGDPTAHAEVLALQAAARQTGSWRLSGATLVVTLEPCTMCAGALVLARVDRLVYGAVDDKAGAVGSLWDVVRDRRLNHRPEVISGVRADECADQLASFFAARRRPPRSVGAQPH